MARGRMLSKTLSCSRRFNALPDIAGDLAEFSQLLFTLLLPHVDDFGRMTADPFSVKLTVLPASERPAEDFASALFALHESELLTVYEEKTDIWLQVNKFDEHQIGLHKRTESKIPSPGNSRKFPEIPGGSRKFLVARARGTELKGRELKGTEGKGTELNRTEEKIPQLDNKLVTAVVAANKARNGNGSHRSKHPIFTGQCFVIFDWMLDDIRRMLGIHTDDFGLDVWFDSFDRDTAAQGLVMSKDEQWPFVQAALLSEAAKRGLPIATVIKDSKKPKSHSERMVEMVQKARSGTA